MARAHAVSGDTDLASHWRERRRTGLLIADDEDRKIFEGDLESA